MKNTLLITLYAMFLAACTSVPGGGAYDPNAKETLGRIVERQDTGKTIRQWGSTSMVLPIGALLIPVPLGPASPAMPVIEHRIVLEDGRTLSVFSTYPDHPVGGCVKIFESPRRDYPRLINYSGCKQ